MAEITERGGYYDPHACTIGPKGDKGSGGCDVGFFLDLEKLEERGHTALKDPGGMVAIKPIELLALVDQAKAREKLADRYEAKCAEFVRMENAWRHAVDQLRSEVDAAKEEALHFRRRL